MKTKRFAAIGLACLLSAGICAPATMQATAKTTVNASTSVASITYSFHVECFGELDPYELGVKIAIGKNGQTLKTLQVDSNGDRDVSLTPDEYDVSVIAPDGYVGTTAKTGLTCDSPVTLYLSQAPTMGTGDMYDRFEITEGSYVVQLNSAEEELFFSFDPSKVGTYKVYSQGDVDVRLKSYAATVATCYPVPDKDNDDKSATDVNFLMSFQIKPQYFYTEHWTDANEDGVKDEDELTYTETDELRETFSVSISAKATGVTFPAYPRLTVEFVSDEYDKEEQIPRVMLEHADEIAYNEDGSYKVYPDQAGVLTAVPYGTAFVYNATDRCYHLNAENGPVVVLKITSVPERLLDRPFSEIGNPSKYENALPSVLYITTADEDGQKTTWQYNKLLEEIYPSVVNKDGVFPLTEDLYTFIYHFIITNRNDIMVNDVPASVRWQAPCYYYSNGTTLPNDKPNNSDWTGDTPAGGNGTQENPYQIGVGSYRAAFGGVSGKEYYSFTATEEGYLTVTTATENACVKLISRTDASEESESLNGVGSAKIGVRQGNTVTIEISTLDWKGGLIPFTAAFEAAKLGSTGMVGEGTVNNPFIMQVGENSVSIGLTEFGWTETKWYAFTPSMSGTYTVAATTGSDAKISVYQNADVSEETLASTWDAKFQNQTYPYVKLELQANVTYYFMISTNEREETVTFTVTEPVTDHPCVMPEKEPTPNTPNEETKGGCGGVVGIGAAALLAACATAFIKKKEND